MCCGGGGEDVSNIKLVYYIQIYSWIAPPITFNHVLRAEHINLTPTALFVLSFKNQYSKEKPGGSYQRTLRLLGRRGFSMPVLAKGSFICDATRL